MGLEGTTLALLCGASDPMPTMSAACALLTRIALPGEAIPILGGVKDVVLSWGWEYMCRTRDRVGGYARYVSGGRSPLDFPPDTRGLVTMVRSDTERRSAIQRDEATAFQACPLHPDDTWESARVLRCMELPDTARLFLDTALILYGPGKISMLLGKPAWSSIFLGAAKCLGMEGLGSILSAGLLVGSLLDNYVSYGPEQGAGGVAILQGAVNHGGPWLEALRRAGERELRAFLYGAFHQCTQYHKNYGFGTMLEFFRGTGHVGTMRCISLMRKARVLPHWTNCVLCALLVLGRSGPAKYILDNVPNSYEPPDLTGEDYGFGQLLFSNRGTCMAQKDIFFSLLRRYNEETLRNSIFSFAWCLRDRESFCYEELEELARTAGGLVFSEASIVLDGGLWLVFLQRSWVSVTVKLHASDTGLAAKTLLTHADRLEDAGSADTASLIRRGSWWGVGVVAGWLGTETCELRDTIRALSRDRAQEVRSIAPAAAGAYPMRGYTALW